MFKIRPQESRRRSRRRPGFTLTELLVTMAIIGIILGYILNASLKGIDVSRQQATQSLIQKLDAAMSERMEALMSVDVEINSAHDYMSRIYNANYSGAGPNDAGGNPNADRARVFALYDFIKSEVPDVFFRTNDPNYPLNFAAQPYPGTRALNYGEYLLPLGAGVYNSPVDKSFGDCPPSATTAPPSRGILGASYAAAAGINKNLGYKPNGYDGIDNNSDGLIDDLHEGVYDPVSKSEDADLKSQILNRINVKHTHKTARSEMLYAILVEGMGPLGSAFAPDDFTTKEVSDTDGDGLPEFIDAWGEPLQFYRWPIFYHSDIQRGYPTWAQIQQNKLFSSTASVNLPLSPYNGVFDEREVDPLDPNQQIVNPGWLFSVGNSGILNDNSKSIPVLSNQWFRGAPVASTPIAAGAIAFQRFFHTPFEPWAASPLATGAGFPSNVPPQTWTWDRSGPSSYLNLNLNLRRSYFTKFLIISSGPDASLGLARLGYSNETDFGSGATNILGAVTAQNVIQIENTAAAIDPNPSQWLAIDSNRLAIDNGANVCWIPRSTNVTAPTATTLYLQQDVGLDDISNHSGQATTSGSNP